MSKQNLEDKEKETKFGCPDCDHDHKHKKQEDEHCHCHDCQCEDCDCEEGKECDCEDCKCEDGCECNHCDCEECECEDGETCECEHCHCGCEEEDDCNCEDCDLEKETDDEEEEPFVGHFHEHPHHHEHNHEHNHEHKHEHKAGKVNEETLYYLDMAQRLKADFDNYKRRNEESTKQSYNLGVSYAVEKLLTVVDSVTQAKSKITDPNTLQGLDLIEKQCLSAFASLGVSKIDSLEKPFDPNFHNAVMTVSDATKPDNVVVDELQAGFMLGDKVIRHSVVRINKL